MGVRYTYIYGLGFSFKPSPTDPYATYNVLCERAGVKFTLDSKRLAK